MNRLTIVISTAVLVFNFSCKSNGTDPEEKKSVRDYTWTIDTLAYEGSSQTLMRSIWGSSASDIYVCGHNANNEGSLWHYGGYFWKDIKLFSYIPRSPYELTAVHGTSSTDVWVSGYRLTGDNPNPPPQSFYQSLILHYDGVTWKEQNVKTKSAVYSIYANAPDDVWACGADGIVYHYDGSSWKVDTIKVSLENNSNFQLKSIVVCNSIEYLLGIKVIDNGIKLVDYFYQRNEEAWSVIDSFVTDSQNLTPKWGGLKLYSPLLAKLYSYGIGGIFEWTGNEWANTYSISGSIDGMYEISNQNILACGSRGRIHHYNGTDWKELENLYREDMVYTGVWMDKDEVFISGTDLSGYPQTTVIWHGK